MTPRPAGRRADAAVATRTQPLVRDYSRSAGAPYRVEFDVRTVYDFVFSLSDDAGSTDDLLEADRRWLTEAKAALPASVKADFQDLFASEVAVVVAGLAVDRPAATSAADLVELVRSSEPEALVNQMFAEARRDPERRPLVDRAAAGDAEALTDLTCDMPETKRQAVVAFLTNPSAMKAPLLGVLEAWLPPFQTIESRVREIIERDVEMRAADVQALAPVELVEKTTGGLRWLSEPGIRRVILAPSYFARPYNMLLSADDWRLFGYPVADAAIEGDDALAPPQSVVRLHRALGDETRLRILKLLTDGDRYLTEIASQLELSKPTIKHHLALLRAAGLVTVTEEGGLTYYSLRRPRLDEASVELKRFLVN
jgi:DNA-binding transcriptional ArsR family regulator